MFVIGSIFTREMKIDLYKTEEFEDDVDVPILYSHSSRGLTNNDSRGIDFVAPGAAMITSFPQWHSKTDNLSIYQGTSIAAPCVTGSIACLLSALKANNIPYFPATIKLALRNTAFLLAKSDKLGFGNGIIQISDAFEYLKVLPKIFSTKNLIPKITLYEFEGNSLKEIKGKSGILWIKKGNEELSKKYCLKITAAKAAMDFQFSWKLKILPEFNNFVKISKLFTEDLISFKIDTNLLKFGSINYAEIHGSDAINPSYGTFFYIPITVIIPEPNNYPLKKELNLKLQVPEHIFFLPPSNVSKCTVKLTALEENAQTIFVQYANEDGFTDDNSRPQQLKFNSDNLIQHLQIPVLSPEKIFQVSFYRYFPSKFQKSKILKFSLEINFEKSVVLQDNPALKHNNMNQYIIAYDVELEEEGEFKDGESGLNGELYESNGEEYFSDTEKNEEGFEFSNDYAEDPYF
uniref:Peptidase S8/S53 domain-containing protein n=1 Tax=Panagrolaimus davidi TaxID=227884 RepID=A0A914QNV9_9BILA